MVATSLLIGFGTSGPASKVGLYLVIIANFIPLLGTLGWLFW
jgi:hypothetical protein